MRIHPSPARLIVLAVLAAVGLTACSGCKRVSERATPLLAPEAPSSPASVPPQVVAALPDAGTGNAASDAASPGPHATGALAAGSHTPSAFCAIFGAFPEGQEPAAEKLRTALLTLGVSSTEVRKTSDFQELAWGQLAVLAVAQTRAGAEASVVAGKAAAKGFVKGCSELMGDLGGPPNPTPAADALTENSDGCIGWNLNTRTAACVTGTSTVQGGENTKLELLGASSTGTTRSMLPWLVTPPRTFDAKVDPKHLQGAKNALRGGSYVALSDVRVRELKAGEEAAWASPRFTIRYERRLKPDVVTVVGSWPDAYDHVELECAGRKTTLVDEHVEGVSDATARLFWGPSQKLLLVEWKFFFGLEGNGGGQTQAHLLAIDKLCAP